MPVVPDLFSRVFGRRPVASKEESQRKISVPPTASQESYSQPQRRFLIPANPQSKPPCQSKPTILYPPAAFYNHSQPQISQWVNCTQTSPLLTSPLPPSQHLKSQPFQNRIQPLKNCSPSATSAFPAHLAGGRPPQTLTRPAASRTTPFPQSNSNWNDTKGVTSAKVPSLDFSSFQKVSQPPQQIPTLTSPASSADPLLAKRATPQTRRTSPQRQRPTPQTLTSPTQSTMPLPPTSPHRSRAASSDLQEKRLSAEISKIHKEIANLHESVQQTNHCLHHDFAPFLREIQENMRQTLSILSLNLRESVEIRRAVLRKMVDNSTQTLLTTSHPSSLASPSSLLDPSSLAADDGSSGSDSFQLSIETILVAENRSVSIPSPKRITERGITKLTHGAMTNAQQQLLLNGGLLQGVMCHKSL